MRCRWEDEQRGESRNRRSDREQQGWEKRRQQSKADEADTGQVWGKHRVKQG